MAFKNVTTYGNDQVSNLLEINLTYFLSDAFMRIGAIGENKTVNLTRNAEDNTIWSDLTVPGWSYQKLNGNTVTLSPAVITSSFPVTEYTVNYSKGQVIFPYGTNILETDTVQATRRASTIGIYSTLDIGRRPLITLGSTATMGGENDYSTFQELVMSEKLIPPFIILETFPVGSAAPVQIGSGQVWATRRVHLNVCTQSVGDLSRILDILSVQSFRTVRCFNTNRAVRDTDNSDAYMLPIMPDGDINKTEPFASNPLFYEDLLRNYYIDSMYWKEIQTRKFKIANESVQMGIAYFTVNICSNPNI